MSSMRRAQEAREGMERGKEQKKKLGGARKEKKHISFPSSPSPPPIYFCYFPAPCLHVPPMLSERKWLLHRLSFKQFFHHTHVNDKD